MRSREQLAALTISLQFPFSINSFLIRFIFFFHRLVGDVLLATAFLSYSGPFNQEFRDLLTNAWKKEMRKYKIPFSEVRNLFSKF